MRVDLNSAKITAAIALLLLTLACGPAAQQPAQTTTTGTPDPSLAAIPHTPTSNESLSYHARLSEKFPFLTLEQVRLACNWLDTADTSGQSLDSIHREILSRELAKLDALEESARGPYGYTGGSAQDFNQWQKQMGAQSAAIREIRERKQALRERTKTLLEVARALEKTDKDDRLGYCLKHSIEGRQIP